MPPKIQTKQKTKNDLTRVKVKIAKTNPNRRIGEKKYRYEYQEGENLARPYKMRTGQKTKTQKRSEYLNKCKNRRSNCREFARRQAQKWQGIAQRSIYDYNDDLQSNTATQGTEEFIAQRTRSRV